MKLSLLQILENFQASSPTVHIKNNHGHKMVVSSDDVAIGTQQRYNIQGDANHNHAVDLSVDAFENLSRGEGIKIKSSINNGHIHLIIITSELFRSDHSNPDQPRNTLIDYPSPTRKKGY